MTDIIRSARLATESKTLPVLPASIAVTVQAAGVMQIDVTPRHLYQEGVITGRAADRDGSEPSKPEVVSYEHYRQRFEGELAELRRQVIESANEEGLKQGRETAEAECRLQLESLRQLLRTAHEARNRYVEDLADEAAEIVFAAVTKILGDGFLDASAARAAVTEAIGRNRTRGKLLVRVSPADHTLLESRRSELLEATSTREIEIVADEQVRLGGCILDCGAAGSLDARLELQLERLRETLLRARASWGDAA